MSDNIIEIGNEILKQVDIVDVISSFIKVSKKGRNYVAICPFHDDTNPSLSISKEKQIFKCFVCGTGGNAISFVKKYKNCSYVEAIKIIAQIAGIHDERLESRTQTHNVDKDLESLYSCLSNISNFYSAFLYQTDEGRDTALKYLYDRGLSDDVITRFKIGYSLKDNESLPARLLKSGYSLKTIEKTGIGTIFDKKIKDNNSGRVIFTICDENGQVIGFSARQLIEDKTSGKYINSPEVEGGVFHKGNILYNYFNAREESRHSGFIYVVEGFMDAIAIDRIGMHNVVAIMGTSLTKEQIQLLRYLNCEIRLCLDNDDPGQNSMIKICKILDQSDLKYRLVSNAQASNGKDSDEILKKDGADGLKKYLINLISEGEFILNYYANRLDLNDLNSKKRLLNEFSIYLSKVKNPVDYEYYTKRLSSLTGFSLNAINLTVENLAKKQENSETQNTDSYYGEVNFYKKDRDLTRLELSERQVVKYMLENQDALKQYELKLGYFVNDCYRDIANLIEQYVESQSKNIYSVNDIINFVDNYNVGLNDKQKNEIINTITNISFSDYQCPPYSVESFDDCVKLINEKKEWHRSYDAYTQASEGKNDDEKAKQAKALLDKRRELILEREKGSK